VSAYESGHRQPAIPTLATLVDAGPVGRQALGFLHAANNVLTEHGVQLPLPGQSTTTPASRLERGLAVQKQIVAGDRVDAMYAAAPGDEQHLQRYLSANCFGDYPTRAGTDVPTRELLTFTMLASLGGCDAQVKGHARWSGQRSLAAAPQPGTLGHSAGGRTQALPMDAGISDNGTAVGVKAPRETLLAPLAVLMSPGRSAYGWLVPRLAAFARWSISADGESGRPARALPSRDITDEGSIQGHPRLPESRGVSTVVKDFGLCRFPVTRRGG
jgi:hypothetical protein